MQTAQSLSIPFPEFATFAALPQKDLPLEPPHSPILEENLLNICKSDEKSLPLQLKQTNNVITTESDNMLTEDQVRDLARGILDFTDTETAKAQKNSTEYNQIDIISQ